MTSLIPLLLYGLAVGVSLGLTGGGGSIITVPLLVYLVGEPVHVAIPTSLVIVGGIAFLSYVSRLTQASTAYGFAVGLAGLVGAVPGRLAAQFFSGRVLLLLFALLMLIAAFFMFRSTTYATRGSVAPNWLVVTAVGVATGFLTGFLGVGGGFLIVPGLVLLMGLQMRSAIPTSLLVIAINCASSLIGPAVLGHSDAVLGIEWRVALIFLVGGLAGGAVGGAVAARLNQRLLKRVFAVFIVVVGLFIAASTTGVIPISVK
jgi:uncharacterized membrane protein YfcA